MARTNLHELSSRLLACLQEQAVDGVFEGKLRSISAEAGLNSVRSAEAVKLLEELGRIRISQRGRRGRDTIVEILSEDPVTLEQAETMMANRTGKRPPKLNYEDLGRAVVDRLLEVARDDALRAAQVEVFAAEREQARQRTQELEDALEVATARETELRIKLKTAEEALERAEENLRRAFNSSGGRRGPAETGSVPDDDTKAVLDILKTIR